MTRTFSIIPGKRESLPLFIGLVGPSSSGKTRSAFELATGIQSVVGGEIVFINTEGKRGLLDIDLFRKPDGSPAIQHMPFSAPYASLDYLDAILQAKESGARTIIIDSMSHEHEAEGGMLDYWEAELERMAGDDTRKRYAMQMLAIAKPKAARRRLLTRGIMQADMNVIACFRAKETSKPVKKDGGKTEVVNMGFVPVAGDEFVYEMSLCCLLHPGSNGVPTWRPEFAGEMIGVKRNEQLADIVPDGQQLSRQIGARLAVWARGEDKPQPGKEFKPDPIDVYAKEVGAMLKKSADELAKWWAETSERRLALNIPEDRAAKMEKLVADKLEVK